MVKRTSKICFCLTEEEEGFIEAARTRMAADGIFRNQSEVIRAAVRMLNSMPQPQLIEAAEGIRRLVPGRRPTGSSDGEST